MPPAVVPDGYFLRGDFLAIVRLFAVADFGAASLGAGFFAASGAVPVGP